MADAWFNNDGEWTFGKLDHATLKDTGRFEYEYQISKADVIAFLETTDTPLSYADTMDGNLLSQTFVWKYERESHPYMGTALPWPSQRGHEWYSVPEYGWPAQMLKETVALEEANRGHRLTRELIRDNLPSIGY